MLNWQKSLKSTRQPSLQMPPSTRPLNSTLVDLIGIVQTKYGVLISKAELPTIKTFAQLYDYIEQHQK